MAAADASTGYSSHDHAYTFTASVYEGVEAIQYRHWIVSFQALDEAQLPLSACAR